MFAIYSIDGRRFRDTLENLRKVQKVQSTHGMQLRSDVSKDETLPVAGRSIGNTGATGVSSDALQAYRQVRQLNRREPIHHAHQLMSQPVSTVAMEMDILAALRYFQQRGFQQMPVVNTRQHLVGMLSIADLLKFVIIDGEQVQYLSGKLVADVMSSEVISADPVSDIRRVAQVMREHHLHGVPIVNESDDLVGIVSRSDILRAVTQDPPLNMWS